MTLTAIFKIVKTALTIYGRFRKMSSRVLRLHFRLEFVFSQTKDLNRFPHKSSLGRKSIYLLVLSSIFREIAHEELCHISLLE